MQLNSYDDKITEECPLQFDTITGTALLTDRQKTWRNITKQALSLKPIRLKRVPTKPFKVFSSAQVRKLAQILLLHHDKMKIC